MKNKILMAVSLIVILAVASTALAVGRSDGAGVNAQAQPQIQTVTAGDDSQIEAENNEPVEDAETEDGDTSNDQTVRPIKAQVREKIQEKVREDIEVDKEVRNQVERNIIRDIKQDDNSTSTIAERRRSRVANAVQAMLQMADRSGGLGERVREIAQNQNQNQEKIEANLEKVQKRNRLIKFLVGPNYKAINEAKNTLAQNRQQIEELNQAKNQLANQADQQILSEQIKTLEENNIEAENSLNASQKGFSLLGWMFKIFSK